MQQDMFARKIYNEAVMACLSAVRESSKEEVRATGELAAGIVPVKDGVQGLHCGLIAKRGS